MTSKWIFICRADDTLVRADSEEEADAQYNLHMIKTRGGCTGPHVSVTDGGDNPRSWEVFEHSVKIDTGMETSGEQTTL